MGGGEGGTDGWREGGSEEGERGGVALELKPEKLPGRHKMHPPASGPLEKRPETHGDRRAREREGALWAVHAPARHAEAGQKLASRAYGTVGGAGDVRVDSQSAQITSTCPRVAGKQAV